MSETGRETRDLAVEANSLINQHMKDCVTWRESVQSTLGEMSKELKSLNNRVIYIIGGIIAITKAADYILPFLHK